MRVDPVSLPPRDVYRTMIALITPRPIGWISSISAAGVTNLAPFSFFNGVAASPPTVVFSTVNHRDGRPKDSLANIEATGEFVVNVADYALREQMNATSEELPPGTSEFEACGVEAAPSERVRPPRVAGAPAAFECALHQIVRVGEGPLAASLVIGRILLMHVADRVLDANGLIDPAALDTIGRLGSDQYVRTTDRFALTRPGGPVPRR